MAPKKKAGPAGKTAGKAVGSEAIEALEMELSQKKLNLIQLTEEIEDRTVECVSTGFPELDYILHKTKHGLPRGRDVEIFSKDAECGKTTLSVQIGVAWQKRGMRVMFADIENTMTEAYLEALGMVLSKEEAAAKGMIPLYWFKNRDNNGDPLPAETILNTIREASNVFDLIIVDSLTAMASAADLEKEASENDRVGGLSKTLSSFFKKNVAKRATILWISQSRMMIGGYNPTGQIRYTTPGGKALGFYSSIRMSLAQIEKIKSGSGPNEEVIGTRVQILTEKNKVSPQFRKVVLTQLMDYGFSVEYNYFELALKLKIIEKSGAWLSFGNYKFQGSMAFVDAMRSSPELFSAIQKAVDGEDAESELLEDNNESGESEVDEDLEAAQQAVNEVEAA